jgi:exodeoxyribonuclease V alpha subunit
VTDLDPAAHEVPEPDVDEVRVARSSRGLLRAFNEAGVLGPAEVHVALRLAHLVGGACEHAVLAAALAVRAPRLGHVCTDLATVRDTLVVEGDVPVDLQALPWPPTEDWIARIASSALVAEDGIGEGDGDRHAPLRLVGSRLYLDRYWREERQVATDLLQRASTEVDGLAEDVLEHGLTRLFPEAGDDRQRRAGGEL